MKVYIASDHAGYKLKEKLKKKIDIENFEKVGKSKFSKKNFAQISSGIKIPDTFKSKGFEVFGNRNYAKFSMEDLSPDFVEGDDYPDYVRELCEKVLKTNGKGILICGTGIGMSIAANKISGIRAALCWNVRSAKYSREDNDANILVLSGWMIKEKEALKIVRVWLKTGFKGAGRHVRRINKIKKIEGCGR